MSWSLASIYKGNDVRTAALQEVEEVYESVIHSLNARYGNRTLLGGFKSDKPAFSANGEYQGDSGSIEIELERGQRIPININGAEAITGAGVASSVNITQVFQRLIDGLKSGDDDLIGSTFPDFQKAVSQLTSVRTEIGARMNRIDRVISSYEMEGVERKEAVAQIEEADPVKVFTELARDQTALKATLDTAQKILTEVPPDKLFR
ncbi:MAG: flagellin [Bdellovibrionota bacterium]